MEFLPKKKRKKKKRYNVLSGRIVFGDNLLNFMGLFIIPPKALNHRDPTNPSVII